MALTFWQILGTLDQLEHQQYYTINRLLINYTQTINRLRKSVHIRTLVTSWSHRSHLAILYDR